jgi:hypothetical protein
MKRIAIAIANWLIILTAFIWLAPFFWINAFIDRKKWKSEFTGKCKIWE